MIFNPLIFKLLITALYFLPLISLDADSTELLIKNVNIVSPERDKILRRANISIINGTINEVSLSKITPKGQHQEIDASGQFLIPGLMDSHVHVSQMPGMTKESSNPKLRNLARDYLIQQPRSYLYFGVTQLLDPSQSQQSLSIFNQQPNKPDLFHCGAVPILRGYPALFTSKHQATEMFSYFVIDESQAIDLPVHIDAREHTAERVVARMKQQGAICVKLFIENGFGKSDHWPMISQHLIQRIVAAAREHGLIVFAHANAIDMQKIALEAGVDVIAHGLWNWNQYAGQKGVPSEIAEHLDKVVKSRIIFQSTFNVMDGLKKLTVPRVLQQPLYQKVVFPAALDWYQSAQGLWFRDEILAEFGDIPLSQVHQHYDQVISQGEKATVYLYKSGLTMVLASDTPSSPTFAAQPGLSTYHELQHMAKIGIRLKDILAAATINNANAFGLQENYGTIEPGKKANLVLLNSNPLTSVSAYNDINKVILGGTVIEREKLSVQNGAELGEE